ncbi:hypothetical protein NTE_01363 [Candidatus Nitrososphaera evergladensis SR1]|uniref:Uncharacterized protein n=1 Tax=Candidatus Nitrososphaera evergladensis SR1 TaxID=1459636 RepID=A0A075MPF1_9ARCH|nr:hypothetical protein NTE_01363 [Candidatus Nitrososphaera evergladensis SR1]
MRYWSGIVKKTDVPFVIMPASNHNASFGPGFASDIRNMLKVEEILWNNKTETKLPI